MIEKINIYYEIFKKLILVTKKYMKLYRYHIAQISEN